MLLLPLLPLPAPLTAGRCAAVAAGGNLINTHIRIGDSFLETVCPTDAAWASGTTQTKILERNGDCGYMAIVQVPETCGFQTTRYVPSKLSVTRARVCDGPRIATKKVSPPPSRLQQSWSYASIQK